MFEHDRIDETWFASAFGAWYPVVYAHRTVSAAAPEAAFAARVLALHGESRLLDLCCGNGRHLVHLANITPHAAGLDYSPDLLNIAQENLALSPARLLRGDMRALPFADGAFDTVTNFFTSFGYFSNAAEDRRTAQEMARVLQPGGRFLLDYLNETYVRHHLVPHSERIEGGYRILETRWIDPDTRRVNKQTEIMQEGKTLARLAESVRLYRLDELEALLTSTGLEINQFFGDYNGNPPAEDRPRLILAGYRTSRHA